MHYSRCLSVKALVFQGDLSLRVGTDKAGTVLSNRLCRGKKKCKKKSMPGTPAVTSTTGGQSRSPCAHLLIVDHD